MWWIVMILAGAVAAWAIDRILYREYFRGRSELPGPDGSLIPFVGCATIFMHVHDNKVIFDIMLQMWKKYGDIYRLYFGRQLAFIVHSVKYFEVFLSSNTLLDKGPSYSMLHQWIGFGLLTSTGNKWRSRRKLLTPAFHFQILNQFLEVFHKNGAIMCKKLESQVDKPAFDIYQYVKLMALQNIYETSMGVSMEVQTNPDIKYVAAVKDICEVLNLRAFIIHLRLELMFRLSSLYKVWSKAVKYIHNDTYAIIRQRREELKGIKDLRHDNDDDTGLYNTKKRFNFLDLLLLQAEENGLTDEDIREEVDTFMFEGHDTITSALCFILYTLAQHENVQEKVYNEQMEILGDEEVLPKSSDLAEMKYLEMVIKECQRLYPSVPLIERQVTEPTSLPGGIVLPKGNHVTLFIYAMHRDPEVWPDPEKFNPDNFLPEAVRNRNPYAYVPFSAGPRNCIGQRYAMLEMKSTVSKIVRRFHLLPSQRPEHELQIAGQVVLISKSGWHIQLESRQNTIKS